MRINIIVRRKLTHSRRVQTQSFKHHSSSKTSWWTCLYTHMGHRIHCCLHGYCKMRNHHMFALKRPESRQLRNLWKTHCLGIWKTRKQWYVIDQLFFNQYQPKPALQFYGASIHLQSCIVTKIITG